MSIAEQESISDVVVEDLKDESDILLRTPQCLGGAKLSESASKSFIHKTH